jgi:hypothetical protein
MLRTTPEFCWLYRRLARAAGLLSLCVLFAFPGLSEAGTRSYELRWRVPPDPDVARYNVYLAFESMGYGEGTDIGFREPDADGVASYTLTDLDESVDYYVAMDAVDTSGNRSDKSNEIMIEQLVAADPCEGVVCDDGDACTIDACDPASGTCFNTPDTTTPGCRPCDGVDCSDGNACTIDTCDPETGACSHTSINCSDGDACTTDSCDPDTGTCSHRGVDCNDGNACTTDSCDPGTGTCSHEGVDCNDGDACTTDSCDPGSGLCAHEPDTTSAECRPDLCDGVDCNDGDACTTDTCDPETGICAHEPDAGDPACQDEEPPGDVGCDDVYDAPSGARLSWTRDPTSTTTVIWDAPLHSAGSQLRHRLYGTAQWSAALDGKLLSFQGCDSRYVATLDGLQPDTRYEYQLSGPSESGKAWTRRQGFRTAPEGDGYLKFAFFASAGIDGALNSDLAGEIASALRGNSFVLGGGGYAYAVDAVASGLAADAPEAVDAWLDQASRFAKGAQFLPVYGDTDVTSPEQRSYYADAHPTFQSGSYSFDAGRVHLVALDAPTLDALEPATAEGAALLDWLDADLGEARSRGARWIVVYMHADPVSSQAGREDGGAALDAFGALLTAHQVSLVLSGDGQSSERSYPLIFRGAGPEVASSQTSRISPTDGTVFLRTGLGGRVDFAGWASSEPPAWSVFRDNQVASFARLNVRGKRGIVVTLMGVQPGRSKLEVLDRFVLK